VRQNKKLARLYSLALVIWSLDFLTKNWAVENLTSASQKVIGTFLQVTLHKNPGAAFSFATSYTIVFTSISIAVLLFILRYSPRITSTGWVVVTGLVLGGVLGNLSDRIFREPGFLYGHVIDWIELPNWPIFNIADSSIVIASLIAFVLTVKNVHPTNPAGHDGPNNSPHKPPHKQSDGATS
jgi:signal peptidase II